jgi:hypothetical protein
MEIHFRRRPVTASIEAALDSGDFVATRDMGDGFAIERARPATVTFARDHNPPSAELLTPDLAAVRHTAISEPHEQK